MAASEGNLSDPEVKEDKKPIVDKILFDSVCGQFSCSILDDANWMVSCYTDQTKGLIIFSVCGGGK